MTIQAGQLPEEVWWVPHATLQVAQKGKFQYLIYLQITISLSVSCLSRVDSNHAHILVIAR